MVASGNVQKTVRYQLQLVPACTSPKSWESPKSESQVENFASDIWKFLPKWRVIKVISSHRQTLRIRGSLDLSENFDNDVPTVSQQIISDLWQNWSLNKTNDDRNFAGNTECKLEWFVAMYKLLLTGRRFEKIHHLSCITYKSYKKWFVHFHSSADVCCPGTNEAKGYEYVFTRHIQLISFGQSSGQIGDKPNNKLARIEKILSRGSWHRFKFPKFQPIPLWQSLWCYSIPWHSRRFKKF